MEGPWIFIGSTDTTFPGWLQRGPELYHAVFCRVYVDSIKRFVIVIRGQDKQQVMVVCEMCSRRHKLCCMFFVVFRQRGRCCSPVPAIDAKLYNTVMLFIVSCGSDVAPWSYLQTWAGAQLHDRGCRVQNMPSRRLPRIDFGRVLPRSQNFPSDSADVRGLRLRIHPER